jgi:hypothetical protein
MTPKEKAEEIYYKFTTYAPLHSNNKQCALIAVDEILNNFGIRVEDKTHYCNYLTIQYYEEVKQEIEKL